MSDPRTIGIFDSGIGGLTVLRELRRAVPAESTVYLGDVARCPYGPRPQEDVRGFAHEIAHFLVARHQVKLIVIACNTASAAALECLRATYCDIPVIGVIEPGARAAAMESRAGRIGVIATPGTVASGAYTRAVCAVAEHAHVLAAACPDLVPLVEAGETHGPRAEAALRGYLTPLQDAGIDTLILGCTHYPLLRRTLDLVLDASVAVVDSASSTAAETAAVLERLDLCAPAGSSPHHRLFTTGSPSEFRFLATRLFGEDFGSVEAVQLAAFPAPALRGEPERPVQRGSVGREGGNAAR